MTKTTVIKMSDYTQGRNTNDILYLNVNPSITAKEAKDLMVEVPPSHRAKVTFAGRVMNFESGNNKVFDSKKETKMIKYGATFNVAYLPKNYFISMLWGTPNPFVFKDAESNAEIKIGACGETEVRLVDPDLFVDRIIGDCNKYTKTDFEVKILEQISSRFNDTFANILFTEKIKYTEFVLKQREIGNLICKMLNEDLTKKYGFEFSSFIISKFNIIGVEKIQEFNERLNAYKEEDFQIDRALKTFEKTKALRDEEERLDDKQWERKKYLLEMEKEEADNNELEKKVVELLAQNQNILAQNQNNKQCVVCIKCGTQNNVANEFCIKCGNKLH